MSGPVSGMVGGYAVTITPPTEPPATTPPPAAARRMLAGVTVDPSQIEARLPLYPGNSIIRVFGYIGGGLPEWVATKTDDRIPRIAALVPGIRFAVTWKDWASDAAARALFDDWLSMAPASIETTGVDICHMHEADAKRMNVTEYLRRQFLLAEWLREHPRGRHVRQTPTQTLQWTMAKSLPGKPKGDGDITKYYAGVGVPALDMYADSWAKTYPDPVKFCEPLWRLRDASGLAPAVPEFGAARLPADKAGTGRAEFIEAVGDQLRLGGASSVCYWDDLGTGGTDLRLTKDAQEITPEVEAWRRVLAANASAGL